MAPGGAAKELTVEAVLQMVGRSSEAAELAMMVNWCADVVASSSEPANAEIASGFLFGFLISRLHENQGVSTVIKTLRGVLSLGPTLISQQKALSLLHMLREIVLTCHAFTDEEFAAMIALARSGIADIIDAQNTAITQATS